MIYLLLLWVYVWGVYATYKRNAITIEHYIRTVEKREPNRDDRGGIYITALFYPIVTPLDWVTTLRSK